MARTRTTLTLCGVLLFGIADAHAQTYPSGPIRWLVGFTAGGTADMISRDIGSHLEKAWGQPVIIENRPGANGSTATAALAAARPDGQTLMMILSGHITNSYLYPGLPFDPLKDFEPVDSKQLKALAVTSRARTDVWPNVPTIAESGVPGYEAELWFGIIAPAGTPDAIIDKINAEVTRFIKSDAMKAKLAAQGARPIGSTRTEFVAFMRAEQDKWGKMLKEIQIKPE